MDHQFPQQIWEGKTDTRSNPQTDYMLPSPEDWTSMLRTLVSLQKYIIDLREQLRVFKGNQNTQHGLRIIQVARVALGRTPVSRGRESILQVRQSVKYKHKDRR